MVAPLVVGASRVVAGTETRSKARERVGTTRKKAQRERSENSDTQRRQRPQAQHVSQTHVATQVSHNNGAQKVKKTISATTTSWFIFWFIGFWPYLAIQLPFYIVGMLGLVAEDTFLIGWLIPGYTVFEISLVLILIIGVLTLAISACIFWFRRISIFNPLSIFVFVLCIAGYWVFFLNFIPWFVFWLWTVIALQTKKQE